MPGRGLCARRGHCRPAVQHQHPDAQRDAGVCAVEAESASAAHHSAPPERPCRTAASAAARAPRTSRLTPHASRLTPHAPRLTEPPPAAVPPRVPGSKTSCTRPRAGGRSWAAWTPSSHGPRPPVPWVPLLGSIPAGAVTSRGVREWRTTGCRLPLTPPSLLGTRPRRRGCRSPSMWASPVRAASTSTHSARRCSRPFVRVRAQPPRSKPPRPPLSTLLRCTRCTRVLRTPSLPATGR